MIHKCPMCRFQPLTGWEEDIHCPECGWNSENTQMVLEETI